MTKLSIFKTCFKCLVSKPLEEFYVHCMMRDGHLNKCKVCTKRDVAKSQQSPHRRAYRSAWGKRKHHLDTYGRELTPEELLVHSKDRYRHARIQGYRSGLEVQVAKQLTDAGISFGYESIKLKYTKPTKYCTYRPDYVLPNGIVVETKGIMTTEDRQKHLLIQAQHPSLDLRFVFSNSNSRIRKGSPTSYAMWATKNNFKFADKLIPAAWLSEKAPT